MPDEPEDERGMTGSGGHPRGESMSNTPARMKPLKLPNTPINGFGSPIESGDDDASSTHSAGEAAGTPLAPGLAAFDAEQREQQTITRLRDLMRILVRALKAKRMYPANNPQLQRILAEATIAMTETLEMVGDIHVPVQQFDLLFLGQSIYNNTNKKESIAFRFSKDGITELVFNEGLASERARDFLA
jgi:hypothetical protein